jgi:hypothetical protein
MHVQFWKITQLRPYPNNPRINDQAVDAVAASIKEFGFRQPIVVDEEGVIVVETKVTDKGINELKGSKKLKILNVKDTKVTEKGIADLKKALPNLDVIH